MKSFFHTKIFDIFSMQNVDYSVDLYVVLFFCNFVFFYRDRTMVCKLIFLPILICKSMLLVVCKDCAEERGVEQINDNNLISYQNRIFENEVFFYN